jgi:integrase
MPRAASGQVVRRKSGAWAVRFRAYGERHYMTLGTAAEGWTRAKAQAELQNILADIRREIRSPPKPDPTPTPTVNPDPTFHEFASQWFEATKNEWRPKTERDYEWQQTHHLLAFFGKHHLSKSRSPRSTDTGRPRWQKLTRSARQQPNVAR